MRLRQRDLKTYYVRPRVSVKDNEGSIKSSFGEACPIMANVQPLSGQVAAAEYGEHLQYILQMRVENLGTLKEKDGVCVNVSGIEDPDYEVISIKSWSIPVIELKKRGA